MNKHLKRILIICGVLVLVAVAVLGVSGYMGATQLTVTRYQVSANVTENLRIVHLTDLHSRVYGENNDTLVQLVAEQKPDMIFLTGDMLSMSDEGPEVVCALIERLAAIAPVYYGYGNHETGWQERTGELLETALTQAGALVLDCCYTDITVKGQQLRIGGYHGYWRRAHMTADDPEQIEAENAFAEKFENTDRIKLLLCHIPTAWLDWELINDCPVDVVFSGHYHGGQVRLPFVGGLYAPYVGWLPEYTQGIFRGEQATCILSTGVGSEDHLPRIFNLPEIVIVDVVSEK